MQILILFVQLLFTVLVYAQTDAEDDFIDYKTIQVINSAGKSFSYGSPQQLEKSFGKASVSKYLNEMADGYAYTYKYKGLTVGFWEEGNKKTCEDIIVTGPNYNVSIKSKIIKVGDKIDVLAHVIPSSYKNRSDNSIGAGIKAGKTITDAFVVISYDDKGCIAKIWIGNDNS